VRRGDDAAGCGLTYGCGVDPAVRLARVPPRPPRSDFAVAGGLAVWALLEALLAEGPGPLAARVLFALVVTLPLVYRRRLPLTVLAIVVVATYVRALTADVPEHGATPFPEALVATFSAALYARTTALAVAGLAGALIWEFFVAADLFVGEQGPTDHAIITFFVVGSWVAGWLVRRRAEQARRALDESGELAREAVAAERARIARELHDVVAHSVSIIAVQAGAADELVERDPAAARRHLDAVRRTAREALVEMRRLLDVLRDEEAAYAPQPTLARVDELVEELRASGVPVELVKEGQRPAVPAGIDLAAYRILQEALTNVRRHAGRVPTRVVIRYANAHIELEVANAPGSTGDGTGSGHGLVGMRERARLYGGAVEAGPDKDGGFAVRARLPIGGAS
jgi:signal transduction histidine kinase